MNFYATMENECFKYSFGRNTEWDVPFEPNQSIALTCAKNDWAAAQFLLYAEEDMLVTTSKNTCFYERYPVPVMRVEISSDTLNTDCISTNLVGLVQDDDGNYKSDALLHETEIFVERYKVQAVWIEMNTNSSTPAGTHTIHIKIYESKIFSDEKLAKELSFTVNVLNKTLESLQKNQFYLDLWQHNCAIARAYDVPLWSEKHFEFMEHYVEALAQLGQKAATVIVSEIPWTGQWSNYNRITSSNTYEYNIVDITKLEDGSYSYNFENLNRYVNLCRKYGVSDEIEVFGLMNIWKNDDVGYGSVIEDYPDAIRLRYYDKNDGTHKYIKTKEELFQYIKALEQNFKEQGWSDKVRILCDEPSDIEAFKKGLSALREIAPTFRFKVAINHVEFIQEDIDGICDYVPGLPSVCRGYEKLQSLKKDVKGRICYYVCCGPEYPNTFLKSPLVEARLIPWISYYLGFDGFLRWNFTVWPNKAFDYANYHHQTFPAGDNTFVYPGKNGYPVLTLRYKNLKRGIRDFEIMNQYSKNSANRNQVVDQIKQIFKFHQFEEMNEDACKKPEDLYSFDWADYDRIITAILQAM